MTHHSPSAGVLVLHAWWGRTDDVRLFAAALEADGFAVAVPDLFGGRTAGTVDEAERLVGSVDPAAVEAAALAALDALRDRVGPAGRVAVLGFSYGAAVALALTRLRSEVTAAVLYYGTGDPSGAEASRAPVLLHLAADDPYEDPGWVAAFVSALRTAGRTVTERTWPATGHWFAEPSRVAFVPDAAEAAYAVTLAFLREPRTDMTPGGPA